MKRIILTALVALMTLTAGARDKNFHIFICIGQSNSEGNARPEQIDKENVPDNFKMMAAVDFKDMGRKTGKWYPAVPPLCRQDTGLTPGDWFGRTMAENLPKGHSVGIINVSVAGCKIEAFMKDEAEAYAATGADWLQNIMKIYGNNPYNYVLALAKKAQKDGVISGILLHQGESNPNDEEWCNKVKSIYDMLLKDLKLKAEDCPLLVGETVNGDRGGVCAGMNEYIGRIPSVIPTGYVISSSGCKENFDRLHFSAEGYRTLGRRYAAKMLSLMGIEIAPEEAKEPESPVIHAMPRFPGMPAAPAGMPRMKQNVTFNISAPYAKEVFLVAQFADERIPMVKNSAGVWSATVQPEAAGAYYYEVDGKKFVDPGNPKTMTVSVLELPSE